MFESLVEGMHPIIGKTERRICEEIMGTGKSSCPRQTNRTRCALR